MKGTRKIQHHPGQENKSGKATYASTTGTNSSTVQSPDKDYKDNMPDNSRDIKKSKRRFLKVFKQ
jgi:hypothetical protein